MSSDIARLIAALRHAQERITDPLVRAGHEAALCEIEIATGAKVYAVPQPAGHTAISSAVPHIIDSDAFQSSL